MVNEHPLIRFAEGPAGRRPALVGSGLDVWEVISVVRDNDGDEEEAAAYLEISVDLVVAAVGYYDAHKVEIDDWIEMNARESDAAYAAWLSGHAADD
jgi:uncharacterized protein (DUF433 family)